MKFVSVYCRVLSGSAADPTDVTTVRGLFSLISSVTSGALPFCTALYLSLLIFPLRFLLGF